MLSKFKLDKSSINCCKCNKRCLSEPVELPCQHLMCSHCVRTLKFKFHFHCKILKVFLKKKTVSQHELENKSPANYLINKLRRTEFKENYLLERLRSTEHEITLNLTLFRRAHFSCPVCKQIYDSNFTPVTLSCFHTVCVRCFQQNKSQEQSECPVCKVKFNTNDSDFYMNDKEISKAVTQIHSFIAEKHAQILGKCDESFKAINAQIELLKHDQIGSKFVHYIKLIEFKADQISIENRMQLNLNKQRDELFKLLETSLRDNLSNFGRTKDRKLYFKFSQLSLRALNLLGNFRLKLNREPLRTIRQLHMNNRLISRSYNLQAKNITHPQIQITGFNWLRQSPKADFLVPCAEHKIFYIYNADTFQTYRFKLADPRDPVSINNSNGKPPKRHIEYEFNFKMKLEYCRFDYDTDRIAMFFERIYDHEYCLKMYSCADLTHAVCVKDFDHFIENFLFNSGETISWSSLVWPYVRYFTSDLREQVFADREACQPDVFAKFYALADCSSTHLVFHNKDTIGVVEKRTGRTCTEIDTKLYEDEEDALLDELHQQRMRTYQSQAKSEYFNVKCLTGRDQLLVSTWSKVYVFDMLNGTLLAKNEIHLIPSNAWLLPNRLYLNRDGDIVFFDTSTSFLTFI
jgi:hypothetical protein